MTDTRLQLPSEDLDRLCRRHRVRSLWLFGSATGAAFDPGRSDLDFLVDLEPMEPVEHKDAYFGLLFGLEDLLGRKIDLVEIGAITNPYFLADVERTRVALYAA